LKIGICYFPINSLGGIINHTEWLAQGLKDLGHDVTLLQMVWSPKATNQRSTLDNEIGHCGVLVNQYTGWVCPARNRVPYKGKYALSRAKERLAKYDLLIWTVPTPGKAKPMAGNKDWMELYDLPDSVRQIGVLHDGNLVKRSAHFAVAEKHFHWIAAVHTVAANTAKRVLRTPSQLVLNPHPPVTDELVAYQDRTRGWFSCQVFKALKRVHELIEAVPYMDPSLEMHVGGSGIELFYMQAKEKCKPRYFHGEGSGFEGRRFWEVAEEHGMVFHDWMKPSARDYQMRRLRCVVDPSWTPSYAVQGSCFNRTVVEAIRNGAIPICRPLNITRSETSLFQPNKHYYPIPMDVTAREYAQHVEHACNLPLAEAQTLIEGGRSLLPQFDYKLIAQQFIDNAMGDRQPDNEVDPEGRAELEKNCEKILPFFMEAPK
jgi:hypothetical protein